MSNPFIIHTDNVLGIGVRQDKPVDPSPKVLPFTEDYLTTLQRRFINKSWRMLYDFPSLGNQVGQDNLYVKSPPLRRHQLNQQFSTLKANLEQGQLVAFDIVTAENTKNLLTSRLPAPLFYAYYTFYFIVRRVLPKVWGFKAVYRALGLCCDISKAEILGRVIYNGYNIVEVIERLKDTLFVIEINVNHQPKKNQPEPSEGIFFEAIRIGQGGQPVKLLKLRSMHPYAEHLQEYIFQNNGIGKGGKFQNDFRVSTGGKLIRKFWIDELPMLFNLLKGDLKLVGVRPLTAQYLGLYPSELQELRKTTKPGLLPPFYADLPNSFDEIVASEMAYLKAYDQNPIKTDWLYLRKIVSNILIGRCHSQ